MTRLDNVDRLSSLDKQVIGQVVTFKGDVLRHARQLKHERTYAADLVAQRRAERGLGRLPHGRARAIAQLDQERDLDPRGAGGGAPAADGA